MEPLTYRTDAGRVPFDDWYRGLDQVAKARVITAMNRLEMGNLSSTKGVGCSVFEFRIDERLELSPGLLGSVIVAGQAPEIADPDYWLSNDNTDG